MSSIQTIQPLVSNNTQAIPSPALAKKTTEKNLDSSTRGLTHQDKLEVLDLVSTTGKGLLIGGVTSTFAQAFATTNLLPALEASSGGFVLGAAVGAGVGLLKAETSNEKLKSIKNTVGGALIGGGAAGILTSVGATLIAAKSTWRGLPSTMFFGLPSVSAKAIGVGVVIGAGVALYASQKN